MHLQGIDIISKVYYSFGKGERMYVFQKQIDFRCVCVSGCVCVAWVFSWGLRFLPKHYLSAAAGWVAHILQSFSMEILQ